MPQPQSRTILLLGLTAVFIGYLMVWLPGPGAGLSFLGIELGEWVKFIQRLKELPDVGGTTVLQNSAVYFTSEVADGGGHSNENRPTLVAGQLGGAIKTGRLLYAGAPLSGTPGDPTYGRHGTWAKCDEQSQDCSKQRPVADLYVSLLNGMAVPTDKFTNSTGALSLA